MTFLFDPNNIMIAVDFDMAMSDLMRVPSEDFHFIPFQYHQHCLARGARTSLSSPSSPSRPSSSHCVSFDPHIALNSCTHVSSFSTIAKIHFQKEGADYPLRSRDINEIENKDVSETWIFSLVFEQK
jgi:hypothetical protein